MIYLFLFPPWYVFFYIWCKETMTNLEVKDKVCELTHFWELRKCHCLILYFMSRRCKLMVRMHFHLQNFTFHIWANWNLSSPIPSQKSLVTFLKYVLSSSIRCQYILVKLTFFVSSSSSDDPRRSWCFDVFSG